MVFFVATIVRKAEKCPYRNSSSKESNRFYIPKNLRSIPLFCLPAKSVWVNRITCSTTLSFPTCLYDFGGKTPPSSRIITQMWKSLEIRYRPWNDHIPWTWTSGKGDSYWKPSFLGAILVSGRVNAKKYVPLKTPWKTPGIIQGSSRESIELPSMSSYALWKYGATV